MSDFDPRSFGANTFLIGVGIAGAVMSTVRSPASIVDEQRLIEHEILRSQIARTKARVARYAADAALADLDASAALRLAAISAGVLKR